MLSVTEGGSAPGHPVSVPTQNLVRLGGYPCPCPGDLVSPLEALGRPTQGDKPCNSAAQVFPALSSLGQQATKPDSPSHTNSVRVCFDLPSHTGSGPSGCKSGRQGGRGRSEGTCTHCGDSAKPERQWKEPWPPTLQGPKLQAQRLCPLLLGFSEPSTWTAPVELDLPPVGPLCPCPGCDPSALPVWWVKGPGQRPRE